MVRQEQTYKTYWLLRNFSPGELQGFTLIETPKKSGKEYDSPIKVRPKRVDSTGIPASTISRFQSGEYTPRERSIKKLSAFYDKYMYNQLRAAGANKEDARSNRTLDPERIAFIIRDYKRWAKKIQKNYMARREHVDLKNIQWGMAHSTHGYNEWEAIARVSGLQKKVLPRPKKPKRPRQYEH